MWELHVYDGYEFAFHSCYGTKREARQACNQLVFGEGKRAFIKKGAARDDRMNMTAAEANQEAGKRTPLQWDDDSADPWATKPKE